MVFLPAKKPSRMVWTQPFSKIQLVELLLGYMLRPTSSEKRRLWKPKQWRLNRVLLAKVVLSRYFWPTSWILLKRLFLSLGLWVKKAHTSWAIDPSCVFGWWIPAVLSSYESELGNLLTGNRRSVNRRSWHFPLEKTQKQLTVMDRFVRYDLHTKLNHCGGFLFGGNVFFFVCFLISFNYTDPFCLALFYFR